MYTSHREPAVTVNCNTGPKKLALKSLRTIIFNILKLIINSVQSVNMGNNKIIKRL